MNPLISSEAVGGRYGSVAPANRLVPNVHRPLHRLLGLVGSFLLLSSMLTSSSSAGPTNATTINLDSDSPGRVFDGLGAASGGGCVARLLINYPEPQRSQILDFFFKPNYGASLHALKVEIGGDGNSTEGSEPSHMHTAADENYNRGFEWWIMEEAKKRNPAITLHALVWDFPGWIKEANSPAAAEYLVKFLLGAKQAHGLDIDTIGIWNETKMDYGFIKLLKKALVARGLKTKIIADDLVNTWAIADAINQDPELRDAVDIVATHYPFYKSTEAARNVGKPIWSSEDGPWNDVWGASKENNGPYAETINRNYIDGRMTSTILWCLTTSYYDILDVPYAGLLRADTPWSGHYEIKSPLWIAAHTAQFTQPGWRYLDQACLLLPRGGSCVTMTHGKDYSVIIETLAARESQEVEFSIQGALSKGEVHVWRTNPERWFEKTQRLAPGQGKFSLTLDSNSVYTITTTTGQNKGTAQATPDKPFPLPYKDDFGGYPIGSTTPNYFIEQNGSYEVVKAGGGRTGRALRQVMNESPIVWTYGHTAHLMGTASIIGDKSWSNYRIAADVFLEEPGYASVMGRVSRVTLDGAINGYQLRLYDSGRWELREDTDKGVIAKGDVPCGTNTWHHIELALNVDKIAAVIDAKTLCEVKNQRHVQGMAGLGNGYNIGQYANFEITPLSDTTVAPANRSRSAAPPVSPEILDVSPGSQSVHLGWSAVAGASGYKIKFGTEADQYPTSVDVGSLTAYTVTTLTNGKEYHFVVVAINDQGESKPSNSVSSVPRPTQP